MSIAIFIIGILNFAIGYALNVYLHRQRYAMPELPLTADGNFDVNSRKNAVNTNADKIGCSADEVVQPTAEIPEEWLELLDEVEFSGTFVEASVEVLRLEVGKYRDEIIAIDRQVRKLLNQYEQADRDEKQPTEEIQKLLQELQETNENWLAKQADANEHLSSRENELGDFSQMGNRLLDILMDQAAQIETTCSNIKVLDFETSIVVGCKRLIREICKLLDMAHLLRDRMQESLVLIMVTEKSIETIDKKMHIDTLTNMRNRIALEYEFHIWTRDDPSRIRQISMAMLDIDQLGKMNEQFDAITTDRIITAFATLIEEAVPENRNNDLFTRFDGQRFVIYMADTGPRNATSTIEKIRQIIEVSTIEIDESQFELTATCAVVEVGNQENIESVCKRLEKTIRFGKKNGKNQTCLDEGGGPETISPPDFDVAAKIVSA